MEALLTDSLRPRLCPSSARGSVYQRQVTGDSDPFSCVCYEFLQDVANGYRTLNEWLLCCPSAHGAIQVHTCVCHLGCGPVFGEILTKCLASFHQCVCHEIVVPDDRIIDQLGTAGFVSGTQVCRAKSHHTVPTVEQKAKDELTTECRSQLSSLHRQTGAMRPPMAWWNKYHRTFSLSSGSPAY